MPSSCAPPSPAGRRRTSCARARVARGVLGAAARRRAPHGAVAARPWASCASPRVPGATTACRSKTSSCARSCAKAAPKSPPGRRGSAPGKLSFRGSLSDDGLYDGSAEAGRRRSGGAAEGDRPALAARGQLSGRMTLQGPLDRPRLRGERHLATAVLRRRRAGSRAGRAHRRGDGASPSTARCRSARVDLVVSGSVRTRARTRAAELRVALQGHQRGSVPARALPRRCPPWRRSWRAASPT
jgi:hypothetical protein